MKGDSSRIPIIDLAPLRSESGARAALADRIRRALRDHGFFYVVGFVARRRGWVQVKSRTDLLDAAPIPGSFVCTIGDMLDRMTGGFYRSTPHRVRNESGRARLSFPFFFDPSFDAEVEPIDPGATVVDDRDQRWDRASVHAFRGTYGDYLLEKVSKVFPQLSRELK